MTDTTRDLIQRLADALTNAIRVIHNEDGTRHISTAAPVLDEALAFLSQPEPEELTEEEMDDLFFKHSSNLGYIGVGVVQEDAPALIREALARAVSSSDRVLAQAAARKLRQSIQE